MALIPPPELEVLEKFANQMFSSIDLDKNYAIDEREFFNYIAMNDEL